MTHDTSVLLLAGCIYTSVVIHFLYWCLTDLQKLFQCQIQILFLHYLPQTSISPHDGIHTLISFLLHTLLEIFSLGIVVIASHIPPNTDISNMTSSFHSISFNYHTYSYHLIVL